MLEKFPPIHATRITNNLGGSKVTNIREYSQVRIFSIYASIRSPFVTTNCSHGIVMNMTSEELKKWRKENGYSQQALADVLGVPKVTVYRWERTGEAASRIPPFIHITLQCIKAKKKKGEEPQTRNVSEKKKERRVKKRDE
jgi:DNA-binding XRE family transcriptional regulator